jgi:hypothetical protein
VLASYPSVSSSISPSCWDAYLEGLGEKRVGG